MQVDRGRRVSFSDSSDVMDQISLVGLEEAERSCDERKVKVLIVQSFSHFFTHTHTTTTTN